MCLIREGTAIAEFPGPPVQTRTGERDAWEDLTPILARAKKAGVSPLGETPVEISTGTWLLAVKDPDGNFIEVIGPRH